MKISKESEEKIHKLLPKFQQFLESVEGKEWQEERITRRNLFQDILSKTNIDDLDRENFGIIIYNLWASQVWTNKEHLIDRLIEDNGLLKIKKELKILLYSDNNIEERFNRFNSKIKGLAHASITEILVFMDSEKYGLWNDKPITILPYLEMDKLLPYRVFKYQLKGEDYSKCIQILDILKNKLKEFGLDTVDYLTVDLFLAYIFYRIPKEERQEEKQITHIDEPKEIKKGINSHEMAQGILVELGNILGFETYISPRDHSKLYNKTKIGDIVTMSEIPPFTYKRLIDTIKEIDVIWFKGEFPKYCFEVEHTTQIKSGLLREYQIRELNVKFFIIGSDEVYKKFKNEINKDPFFEIKDRYNFKSYKELLEFFNLAVEFHKLKEDFKII